MGFFSGVLAVLFGSGLPKTNHSEAMGGAGGKGLAQDKSVCHWKPPAGAWNVLVHFEVLEGYSQGKKKYSKRFVNVGHRENMTEAHG